jgi:hypothetical protein
MTTHITNKWQQFKQWLKAELGKADEIKDDEDWYI